VITPIEGLTTAATSRRWLFRASLASGAVAFAAFAVGGQERRPLLLTLAGAIVGGWGLAIAANYRGIADALPRREGTGPFRLEYSRAMIRLVFGGFAVWGASLVAVSLYHAVR
jgi:hypothetical protein